MGTHRDPKPNDCFYRAEPDEPMFTLLGRDESAPALVRAWALERATLTVVAERRYGMDPERVTAELDQAHEAVELARAMNRWERCPHLSATGVDQEPDGPHKVWRCDGCGRLHWTRHIDGEHELMVEDVPLPPEVARRCEAALVLAAWGGLDEEDLADVVLALEEAGRLR